MSDSTSIEDRWAQKVCRMGQGAACCSFLAASAEGMGCAKRSDFEALIRGRRETKSMIAMSDNCSGPPNFQPTEMSN